MAVPKLATRFPLQQLDLVGPHGLFRISAAARHGTHRRRRPCPRAGGAATRRANTRPRRRWQLLTSFAIRSSENKMHSKRRNKVGFTPPSRSDPATSELKLANLCDGSGFAFGFAFRFAFCFFFLHLGHRGYDDEATTPRRRQTKPTKRADG